MFVQWKCPGGFKPHGDGHNALLKTNGLWTSMSRDMFLQMDGAKNIDYPEKQNFVSSPLRFCLKTIHEMNVTLLSFQMF